MIQVSGRQFGQQVRRALEIEDNFIPKNNNYDWQSRIQLSFSTGESRIYVPSVSRHWCYAIGNVETPALDVNFYVARSDLKRCRGINNGICKIDSTGHILSIIYEGLNCRNKHTLPIIKTNTHNFVLHRKSTVITFNKDALYSFVSYIQSRGNCVLAIHPGNKTLDQKSISILGLRDDLEARAIHLNTAEKQVLQINAQTNGSFTFALSGYHLLHAFRLLSGSEITFITSGIKQPWHVFGGSKKECFILAPCDIRVVP